MTPLARTAIAALSLSAAGLVGIATQESYTDKAIVPVAGDRPTFGFGSTMKPDGTPVQLGDKTDPVSALKIKREHIAKDELNLKRCVTAPLSQKEYDRLVDFAYQYGSAATCKSTLVKLINEGRYAEACEEFARWRKVAGRDCSIRSNGCYGVYTRAVERTAQCRVDLNLVEDVPAKEEPVEAEPSVEQAAEPQTKPKRRAWPFVLALLFVVTAATAGAFVLHRRKK